MIKIDKCKFWFGGHDCNVVSWLGGTNSRPLPLLHYGSVQNTGDSDVITEQEN